MMVANYLFNGFFWLRSFKFFLELAAWSHMLHGVFSLQMWSGGMGCLVSPAQRGLRFMSVVFKVVLCVVRGHRNP